MASKSFVNASASIGKLSDSYSATPLGVSTLAITPTIPAAPFVSSTNNSNNQGGVPTQQAYNVSNNTTMVLTLINNNSEGIEISSGSLAGVFWTDANNNNHYVLDCVVSANNNVSLTLTTPTLPSLTNGSVAMSNFATIVNNSTPVTVAFATLATADQPSNPDVSDISIPSANVAQLLVTCAQTGGTELFNNNGNNLVFAWDYPEAGSYYNFPPSPSNNTVPFSGTVTKARFYNSSAKNSNVMGVGVNLT